MKNNKSILDGFSSVIDDAQDFARLSVLLQFIKNASETLYDQKSKNNEIYPEDIELFKRHYQEMNNIITKLLGSNMLDRDSSDVDLEVKKEEKSNAEFEQEDIHTNPEELTK